MRGYTVHFGKVPFAPFVLCSIRRGVLRPGKPLDGGLGSFFIRAEAPSLSAKDCRAEYTEAVRDMSSSWKWKNPSSVKDALGSIAEAFPSLGGTVKELREASPQAGS